MLARYKNMECYFSKVSKNHLNSKYFLAGKQIGTKSIINKDREEFTRIFLNI